MPQLLLNNEGFLCLGDDTNLGDPSPSELNFSSSATQKGQVTKALSVVQSQLNVSAGAMRSGRSEVITNPSTVLPPFSGGFVASFYSQNVEIESLVRLQTKQLQSGIEILSRKHHRDLLSVVQQQAVKRLRVKEVQLESVMQRNKVLEEQVMQMSGESSVWFNYAQIAESVVSDLKAKIYDILSKQKICTTVGVEEGYGDSGGDSESVCEADQKTELHGRTACRVCQGREACMLLLPCRHLCLCKHCEAWMDSCPVCNSKRNHSIEVVV